MERLSDQPDIFGNEIASIVSGMKPESRIEYRGELKLIIDGNPFDISNLFRMVKLSPENGTEIAITYFEKMLSFYHSELDVDVNDFLSVVDRLMPKIMTQEQADKAAAGSFISMPWINDCVISIVIDFPDCIMSVTPSMLRSWCINDVESIYSFAIQNLWKATKGKPYDILAIKDDNEQPIAKICIFDTKDGYDAARLLLPGLYPNLAEELGNEFYAAIPCRDMFLAIGADHQPSLLKIAERVKLDAESLPHPLSPKLFLCVKDGIAPGHLDSI